MTALARIVFRDPERAMTVVLDALPDQTRFDQMLAPVFASPAGLTATFGELAGTKGWLAPRAERQARAAAERTAASFVVEVRECSGITPAPSAWRSRPSGRRVRRRRSRSRVCRRRPSRRSSRSRARMKIGSGVSTGTCRAARRAKGDPGVQRGGRTQVRVCGDDRAGVAATHPSAASAVRAGAAAA